MNARVRIPAIQTEEQRAFREVIMPPLCGVVGDQAFGAWLSRIHLVRIDGTFAELSTPTTFIASWARRHYTRHMLDALRVRWPHLDRVIFVVRAGAAPPLPVDPPALSPAGEPTPVIEATTTEEPISPEVKILPANTPMRPERLLISDVLNAVAAHYNVPLHEMLSQRRTADIVRPRQVAMYLSKALTQRSFPEIGRRLGGRDHSTVLHAVTKLQQLEADDPKLAIDLNAIRAKLREVAQ